jgi:hypothetical protein
MVDVVDAKPVSQSGDSSVEGSGYHQELKRTLGSFQVFAISFAGSSHLAVYDGAEAACFEE